MGRFPRGGEEIELETRVGTGVDVVFTRSKAVIPLLLIPSIFAWIDRRAEKKRVQVERGAWRGDLLLLLFLYNKDSDARSGISVRSAKCTFTEQRTFRFIPNMALLSLVYSTKSHTQSYPLSLLIRHLQFGHPLPSQVQYNNISGLNERLTSTKYTLTHFQFRKFPRKNSKTIPIPYKIK